MKFRTTEREPPDINLTPLIDVVFLLLIFFMVSTTFDRASELSIDLPESSAAPESEQKVVVDVAIDGNGRVYVNGRQLINRQLGTLQEALKIATNGNNDIPVVVNADANTPYQTIVTIMDAARKLGLARLRFPTEKAKEE